MADNPGHLQSAALAVAIDRAKEEQAHYQAQFDAMIADNTDLDTGTDGVQSLMTRYRAYTGAKTTRDNAGVALEEALGTRETATTNVVNSFTNAQSFYQQLVDYRDYLHQQAVTEETALKAKTGDDAATAAQITAAETKTAGAMTKLTEAEDTQMSFQDMLADDSPVKGLVEELLKGDTVGDDGGLLVSAIDGAYDAANNAVDALTAMGRSGHRGKRSRRHHEASGSSQRPDERRQRFDNPGGSRRSGRRRSNDRDDQGQCRRHHWSR